MQDASALSHLTFASRLRNWRRSQMLKQETLAEMMGVTQAAVSRWENGLDEPSPFIRSRLRNLMADRIGGELAVERLMLSRLPGRRALFDLDGCRLVAFSAELEQLWPSYGRLMGRRLQDHTIGEMRQIIENPELVRDIRHGEVAMISGTSIENLRFRRNPVKHSWHIGFRQSGRHLIADMVYQDAAPEDAIGIHGIIRMDEI